MPWHDHQHSSMHQQFRTRTTTIKSHHWKERVQWRAARFVTNNYRDYVPAAVTNMITQLGWDKSRLTMMYKISHGLVDVSHKHHLIPGDRRTRGTIKIREIAASRDGYKYSVYPRTTRQWNRLPSDTTAAPSMEGFKVGLDRLPAGHHQLISNQDFCFYRLF